MSRRKINEFESFQRMYGYTKKRSIKSKLLDGFCKSHGYNRKYAIRRLKQMRVRSLRGPGPSRIYEPKLLLEPLKRIWFATDQMCSKRLHVAMRLWLPHYRENNQSLDPHIVELLLQMSPSTIDRLLKPVRKIEGRRRRCGTKPGTLLKNRIEIKTEQWDIDEPGFMEADTVAHCGMSLAGDFVWTLTMTDIYSGWTENRACWNKGADGVLKAIAGVEAKLPFILKGFDCDNGSEFLNHHLLNYLRNRKKPVEFTRSRPYRKDDNAHVEQRNWTHVRQLLGYTRFENPKIVELLNELYANEWSLLNNYFCPSMKLEEKIKINSKYKVRHKAPASPCERLLASEGIDKKTKAALTKQFESLNPFDLRKKIEEKLEAIFNLVHVTHRPRKKI